MGETLAEAVEAEKRGANRLELCSALDQDGLTPAHGLIRQVMEAVQIPVMVMVRPRGGGFVYTREELEWMKE